MNFRSPACLAATLMLIVVSAPNSPSSCSSAFTASAVTNWVIGSIRPSSMASPTKSLGAWMVPRSSHQRISASNPTTSSLRISTFGWNAQRNCRSRIQPLLQLHARGDRLPHVAVEHGGAALAAALGPRQRAVRVAPQRRVILAVVRAYAHADRGRGEHLEALDVERLLQRVQQMIDQRLHLVVAFDRLDQQDEFIAADPRQHVGLADPRADALRHLDQQRVADGMAE